MNREILFRAKRSSDGGWVEGDLLHLRGTTSISDHLLDGVYDVDPDTVGQYTGLTDKNGKKIFEGDILKFKEPFRGADSTIFVVEWDDVNARFLGFTVGGIGRYMVYVSREPKCEIIGNIHDNPELLKGDKA